MGSAFSWRLYTGGHLGRVCLSQLPVTAMTCAPHDRLWVAFDHIIASYQEGAWEYGFHCPAQVTQDAPIEFMWWWQDAGWIGSYGLWRFQDRQLERIAVLPEDRVLALFCTNPHLFTIGFEQAGIWYTSDQEQWVSIANPGSYERLLACTSDALGNLWGVFQGNQLPPLSKRLQYLTTVYANRTWTNTQQIVCMYDMARHIWTNPILLPKPIRVMDIRVDASSVIWISTEGDGIWQYTKTTWNHMSPNARKRAVRDLPSKYIIALYADDYARIWSIHLRNIELGVYEAGIWYPVFIAPRSSSMEEEEHTIWIPNHTNAAFYDAEQQRIWIGTGGGEVGWIDVTSDNQRAQPSTSINYEALPIYIDVPSYLSS